MHEEFFGLYLGQQIEAECVQLFPLVLFFSHFVTSDPSSLFFFVFLFVATLSHVTSWVSSVLPTIFLYKSLNVLIWH